MWALRGSCERIRLGGQEVFPCPGTRLSPRSPAFNKKNGRIKRIADEVEKEVRSRVGPNSTLEERRRVTAEVLREVGWTDEEKDLCGLVSNAPAIEVEGKHFARLSQNSSVIIFGLLWWASH